MASGGVFRQRFRALVGPTYGNAIQERLVIRFSFIKNFTC